MMISNEYGDNQCGIYNTEFNIHMFDSLSDFTYLEDNKVLSSFQVDNVQSILDDIKRK